MKVRGFSYLMNYNLFEGYTYKFSNNLTVLYLNNLKSFEKIEKLVVLSYKEILCNLILWQRSKFIDLFSFISMYFKI